MKKWLVFLLLLSILFAGIDDKRFTIKGSILPGSVLSIDTEGSGLKYDIDYRISPGFGLSLDWSILSFADDKIENLIGVSHSSRDITKGRARITYHDGFNRSKKDVDKKIQINSCYVKSRAFFDWPLFLYISGKVSYNFIKLYGADDMRFDGGLGWGCSFGTIINDFDIELSYDKVNSKIDIEDGYASLNGDYRVSDITLALGYKF